MGLRCDRLLRVGSSSYDQRTQLVSLSIYLLVLTGCEATAALGFHEEAGGTREAAALWFCHQP